jgi:hypothetical protein
MHLDDSIQKEANQLLKVAVGVFSTLIISWFLLFAIDNFIIGNDPAVSRMLILATLILFYLPLMIAFLIYMIIKLIHMYGYTEYNLNISNNEFTQIIKSLGFSEKSSKYIKKVGINQYMMIDIVTENKQNVIRIAGSWIDGSFPFKIYKKPLSPRYNNMTYYYVIEFFSKLPKDALTLRE